MHFEWDENKNRQNKNKHDVSFEEAEEVFDDPFHIAVMDKRFDYFEERWITIGSTKSKKILVIGHLYYLKEDGEEIIRIVTARRATKKEREQYENINN